MRNVMPSLRWGRDVFVKENVLEILRREVRRKPKGVVGVSTATDPYQPAEKGLEVTRRALTILIEAGFPVSIQTKSPLVVRDIDLIRGKKIDVGFTITSTDKEFQRKFEPGAPPPEERISALETVSSLGIITWIFYGPIIPGYNDAPDEMERIVRLGAKTKSKIIYDRLNIKPTVIQRLKVNYPSLSQGLPASTMRLAGTWMSPRRGLFSAGGSGLSLPLIFILFAEV
jgi:DNA repair photolyase